MNIIVIIVEKWVISELTVKNQKLKIQNASIVEKLAIQEMIVTNHQLYLQVVLIVNNLVMKLPIVPKETINFKKKLINYNTLTKVISKNQKILIQNVSFAKNLDIGTKTAQKKLMILLTSKFKDNATFATRLVIGKKIVPIKSYNAFIVKYLDTQQMNVT